MASANGLWRKLPTAAAQAAPREWLAPQTRTCGPRRGPGRGCYLSRAPRFTSRQGEHAWGSSQPGQDSTLPSRPFHLRQGPGQLPAYCLSAPKRPFLPTLGSGSWTLKRVALPAAAVLSAAGTLQGTGFPRAPGCPLLTPQAQGFVLGEFLCVPGFPAHTARLVADAQGSSSNPAGRGHTLCLQGLSLQRGWAFPRLPGLPSQSPL